MSTRRANLVLVLLAAFVCAAGCRDPRRVEYSVPSLVTTLREDKDPNMRYWAAESLGKFGPEAQAAVPALQEAAKDSETEVRDAAATATKQIRQKGKKR